MSTVIVIIGVYCTAFLVLDYIARFRRDDTK
jgi:hypothetical protein